MTILNQTYSLPFGWYTLECAVRLICRRVGNSRVGNGRVVYKRDIIAVACDPACLLKHTHILYCHACVIMMRAIAKRVLVMNRITRSNPVVRLSHLLRRSRISACIYTLFDRNLSANSNKTKTSN